MKFSIQLSSDYPDKAYGGDRVYQDMLAQATLADGWAMMRSRSPSIIL